MPVLTVEAPIEPVVVVNYQPGGAIGLDVLNLLGITGRVLYLAPLNTEPVSYTHLRALIRRIDLPRTGRAGWQHL